MLAKVLNRATSVALALYDDFKEFLSPSSCLCCGRDRVFADPLLCPECEQALTTKNIGQGPVCPFCGRPDGAAGSCSFCKDRDRLKLFYWGVYDEELKTCILQFKFHRAKELGVRLTSLAMASLDERLNHLKYDLVVPVPLHKARVRSREYNQSEIISMEVARCLNIEHVADVLVRHRHTLQQAKLEEDKRWSNVENAFGVRNDGVGVLLAKRILLVDDIVTTGATVFEASKPLLRVGARQVDIFSLAYAI